MSEKPSYQNVELTAPHNNGGKDYAKGDVLRLRDDQVKRLGKGCKPAAKDAKPLNVKEEASA